jgi:hypothetical protein
MPADPSQGAALGFALFRFAYVVVGLLALAASWRRPRPGALLVAFAGLNVAAWAVYVAPLGRLYGLEEHLDRAFNVGMAACTAAGGSPFEHTQVGFANLEPLWTFAVAALSLFRPERVMHVYHWLPALALVATAAGFYFGLKLDAGEDDAWERLLIVFAVLGLSSFSLSQRPPIPPLWPGNFVLKPNHAVGWPLVAIVAGMFARRVRTWTLALLLGLLAWVFILHWAYLVAGLGMALLLGGRSRGDWRRWTLAAAVSAALAAPYVLHLAREHNPLASGSTPKQIWLDPLGQHLAPPYWATLDLGLLFVLGLAGAWVAWRRRSSRDLVVLGLAATLWILWVAYEGASFVGLAPEADEQHYFLRIVMAMLAGTALAAAARHVQAFRALRPGQGALIVMALLLPLTFPAYWDPPTMDRYYRWSLPPLGPKLIEYGRWVRENTPRDALFVAGRSASTWIPALAGRQVLLTDDSRPPADFDERRDAEHAILVSGDPERVVAAARRYGITHVAIDGSLEDRYGAERLRQSVRLPVFEPLYASSAVRILRIRLDGLAAAPAAEARPERPNGTSGREN